ncbi:MAG TPA: Rne/Rng family ribonuclease [Symbiobacteriaceae bacterium]|nr:Rne/Rng family ribonuclease [Symbiobacteriaceae bacterium]
MAKEILVTVDVDETRAAVLEDGELVELFVERPVHQRVVGNIYKGKVENVLPGMQAAFVDVGLDRNSFLYVDDALPGKVEIEGEVVGEGAAKGRLTIKEIVRPGQEIIVQVAKEPIGTKGARVTRHITLPGRFLVLMPQVDYIGVSRRIGDEKERERLKQVAARVKPEGAGLIVRTVAEGAHEEELAKDAAFLVRLWERISNRAKTAPSPSLLHRDLGLVHRIVRDWFDDTVDQFTIDHKEEYQRALEVLDLHAPHLKERIKLYTRPDQSLFDFHGIEMEIDKALKRRVWLKSGGYLVIDQTEALTAIDVNTGKFVGTTNLADTVFKTNLEAAKEIARQLRLRDIGGIIIIDFIDMEVHEHRQKVLKTLEEELRRDRTRANVLGLTQLGLLEMTRKKSRQNLDEAMMRSCHYCDRRGKVLSEETMARRVRAEIRRILKQSSSEALLMEVHPSVAALLIGAGGANLKELEAELGKLIYIRGNNEVHLEEMHLRVLGTRAEVEERALPVKVGQVVELKIDEAHVTNTSDGIARVDGYVIDVEDAGTMVGKRVRVEVTKAYRTYAKGRMV